MSKEQAQVDLLVAGAGGGLVGALRAAHLGRSVLVVEATSSFRRANNTSMSTAMIPGAGSRYQKAAGLNDSPARFIDDVMHKTRGQADPVVTTALAEVSAELIEWLADATGAPIELMTDFAYPGHSVHRCHTGPGRSGAYLVDHLAKLMLTQDIDLLVPARLQDVRPDGSCLLARVGYPDGSTETVAAGAVLLATNGFGAAPDLVARHIPEIAGARYHGSAESRGEALGIGARLGAATGFLDAYQGHGALSVGAGTLVGWATVMHGGVVVNRSGDRFGDESCGYSEFAGQELRQPDGWAAIVFDDRILGACMPFTDFRQTLEMGVVLQADDVAGLAAALDVDATRLQRTLNAAEAARAGTAPDPFGRTDWGPAPLHAPFAAVRVEAALFHTQGGLVVDGHARVLDEQGTPIPGLYAAGGAAIGISGHGADGYLAGNGLLSALGLSYLAATHVSTVSTL